MIALAEKHAAPVWVAPMSARAGFPEDHPLFCGFLNASRNDICSKLEGRDVVVVLGGPLSRYHTEDPGPQLPSGTRALLITDDPSIAAWAPTGDAVVSDIKLAVRSLLEHDTRSGRARPRGLERSTPAPATPMSDAFVLSRIAELRPSDAIIVEEAPSSRNAMHAHLPITQKDSFFTGASGGLGHGLPAAIGVALGRPGRRVIAILGDGSSMYAIQGLWTAAQLDLPITFLVLQNRRYHALVEFGRHFGLDRDIGTDLPDISFSGLARAQGVAACEVSLPAELESALQASFADTRPMLLAVSIA